MKKFEAGKIYCQANTSGHGGCFGYSRIYVHSAGKMLVYSHITVAGKKWSFSESGKDRAKIQSFADSEYVQLPIGVCGEQFRAEYELITEVQND